MLWTGRDSAATGAAVPEGGAPASASEPGAALGSPPASLAAPAQAEDDGGGLDLAQGGLTWSGDLDLPGSLTCPSLTAGLAPVTTRHVRILACAAMQEHLPDLNVNCSTACSLPTDLSATQLAAAPAATPLEDGNVGGGAREWGPGLRDRLELVGQPIAAHHGPVNAVAIASVATEAMAYCVGQTGMLRIFTLAGAQVRGPNFSKCNVHSILHDHKCSICLVDLLLARTCPELITVACNHDRDVKQAPAVPAVRAGEVRQAGRPADDFAGSLAPVRL